MRIDRTRINSTALEATQMENIRPSTENPRLERHRRLMSRLLGRMWLRSKVSSMLARTAVKLCRYCPKYARFSMSIHSVSRRLQDCANTQVEI